MPSLRVQHVSFSFGVSPLFDDVSFELSAGWTGLVGPNGSGKSTLLELLAGIRPPQSGSIALPGEVVLCEQRVEAPPAAELEALRPTLHRWAGRLELDVSRLAQWSSLSPGERKRWQLADALSRESAALLLDEPTNHLDAEGLRTLASALKGYRGVGVVVSHDRAFLDALTSSTLRLVSRRCEWRRGAYSQAREAWELEERTARASQLETRRQLEGAQRRLADDRRTLEASSASRGARKRMKDRNDSDARTLGANFAPEMAEMAHAAALRRTKKKSERIEAQLESLDHWEEPRTLFVRDAPCPRALVATLSGDVVAGGRTLVREVHLDVPRARHVVIAGPNGSGKSTLLRRLLEVNSLPPERVLVLPQELTEDELEADVEELKALDRQARGAVLQLVDALGTRPEQLLETSRPSPGEGRKLRLALGLGRAVWLGVLDEPTNHLDLPSVERLQAALAAFPGTLVICTHDTQLAKAVAHETWTISGERLSRLPS